MSEHRPQHIAILGVGGVGGLLAGLLDRAGYTVTVVATESTSTHLNRAGLRLSSERFGEVRAAVRAVPRLEEAADVLLVTVKAPSLEAALARVPEDKVRGALVVPLLNGLEHLDFLRAHYPEAAVAAASIWVSAARPSPGVVEVRSPFARVELAHGPAPRAAVEGLAAALGEAGLDVELGEEEARLLWKKFHFLAPMALVCAHAQAPVGVVRTERRADLIAVAQEVAAVAATQGVELDPAHVVQGLDTVDPSNKPSLLYDRETGAPMEVDALGGALVRAAERTGIPAPVTARLTAELHAQST